MFLRRFLLTVLMVVIVVGLVAMGGAIGYRAGFSQGYLTQQLAAQADGKGVAPFPPAVPRYPYPPVMYGPPFLPGLGALFLIGLMILFGLAAVRALTFHGWAAAGGPHASRHWMRHGGSMPPWCAGWPGPSQEPANKGEPATEAGGTQTTG
jgi:hypothetical protein